ncbi:hypothetical protein GWK47_004567 [Chionoecetes opilio]|uniref:Uncharacterized protein n=1 Tax=Chionoecetes opilio TaxID=41210 RepID=A0A8J4YFV7_CHIOP|nr:hypothetical protein GWK47_004567 [Chionoecetes opilio]
MSARTQLVVAWAALLISAWPLDRVVEHFVQRLPPKSDGGSENKPDRGGAQLRACLACRSAESGFVVLSTETSVEAYSEVDERLASSRSLLRATDTAVHGLIGGFSYWMACIICPDLVLNVNILLPYLGFGSTSNGHETAREFLQRDVFFSFCVAFMISSCIDLDHIVKAVNVSIKQEIVL